MKKPKHQFEDFLALVDDEYKDFVTQAHERLQNEYKVRIQNTKNGLSISYSQPGNTWRILGLSFREGNLVTHINTENYAKYIDVIGSMPESVAAHVANAWTCKKLLDPPKRCWDTCEPGYDFYVDENRYQKCRY